MIFVSTVSFGGPRNAVIVAMRALTSPHKPMIPSHPAVIFGAVALIFGPKWWQPLLTILAVSILKGSWSLLALVSSTTPHAEYSDVEDFLSRIFMWWWCSGALMAVFPAKKTCCNVSRNSLFIGCIESSVWVHKM